MDMNRVIILESLLALAAVVVLGPGTSMLAEQAALQAFALVRRRRTARYRTLTLADGRISMAFPCAAIT